MGIYRLGEVAPVLEQGAFVAPTATLIGNVVLAQNASVWFGAVLRGDNEAISIGPSSNVQDCAVMHTDPGFPLYLGAGVSIGHQAMLHGCEVGDGSLIGIQAVVMNGVRIGKHCLVAAGAVVSAGKVFPDGVLIMGAPARVTRALEDNEIAGLARVAEIYVRRSDRYRRELELIRQGVLADS